MKKPSFQNRSCSSRNRNRSRSRRMMLAALIAGSSLMALDASADTELFPSHPSGGISILVHQFEPDSAQPVASEKAAIAEKQVAVSKEGDETVLIEVAAEVDELASDAPVIETIVAAAEVADEAVLIDVAAEADELASDAPVIETIVAAAEAGAGCEEDFWEYEGEEEAACQAIAAADSVTSSGTHDTIVAVPAGIAAHRTSSDFNQVIAAAVAASAARAGISAQHFLEPFAMVNPIESAPLATIPLDTLPAAEKDDALESVNNAIVVAEAVAQPAEPDATPRAPANQQLAEACALDQWWQDDPCGMPYQSEFDELFELEAADSDGSETLSSEIASDSASEAEPVEFAGLVGSAPVITTIAEAYAPYDLAERDLKLLNLHLSTVTPIRSKNYVTIQAPEEVTEAETTVSPDCLLDEIVHNASELLERTRITDLTFASLGESFGDWFAELSAPAQPAAEVSEIVAREIAELEVEAEMFLAPVGEEATESASQEQLVAAEPATDESAADEFAICELAEMEVEAEMFLASLAEEAASETLAPEVSEIVASEIATMEVDGEMIPAPVADDAPDAAAQEQFVASEPAAVETPAAEVSEVAASEIASTEVDRADLQVSLSEIQQSISGMVAMIQQWHQETAAALLAADQNAPSTLSEASTAGEASAAKIAERSDADKDNVLR